MGGGQGKCPRNCTLSVCFKALLIRHMLMPHATCTETMWILHLLVALFSSLLAMALWYINRAIPVSTAIAAKKICSGVFLAKRNLADIVALDVTPSILISPLLQLDIDRPRKMVTGVALGYQILRSRFFCCCFNCLSQQP